MVSRKHQRCKRRRISGGPEASARPRRPTSDAAAPVAAASAGAGRREPPSPRAKRGRRIRFGAPRLRRFFVECPKKAPPPSAGRGPVAGTARDRSRHISDRASRRRDRDPPAGDQPHVVRRQVRRRQGAAQVGISQRAGLGHDEPAHVARRREPAARFVSGSRDRLRPVHVAAAASARLRGISASRPRRRRLRGISASRPRRRRLRGTSASRPRRRHDSSLWKLRAANVRLQPDVAHPQQDAILREHALGGRELAVAVPASKLSRRRPAFSIRFAK